VILEFATANFYKGTPLVEAALESSRFRLRPSLMTAFAFILGCVRLWTATGSGAQARRTIGTVCIGGMLAASLLEIFVIPVLFVLVERISHRFKKSSHEEAAATALVTEGGAE
jgi:HAE1 family hydrophobic/amphiphilic exporter-1